MSDGPKDDEIESLNPERLNVDALSAEDLAQASGGLYAAEVTPCDGFLSCGGSGSDFYCSRTFGCTAIFQA